MISKNTIQEYLDNGINTLCVDERKGPYRSWKHLQSELQVPKDYPNAYGIGIICGKISGGLEIIDIDLKYDITNTLYDRYKKKIHDTNPNILKKLMVVTTPSKGYPNKGYHWIYRCSVSEKNLKLAERNTTQEEKEKHPKENTKVLIETRGEGGYACTYPTPNYEIKHKDDFSQIETITPEEREILFSCAREFDEIEKIASSMTKKDHTEINNAFNISSDSKVETVWKDYNDKTDISTILIDQGWSYVSEDNLRSYWKRPGDTTAKHSGNILLSDNCFKTFSTSTELDPDKTYGPSELYVFLVHNGDRKSAWRDLYDQNFGERLEKKQETSLQYSEIRHSEKPIKQEEKKLDVVEYLADYESDYDYLQSVRNGTVAMGLSTGSDYMDKYFLFKPASYIVAIGHTNVGKSLTILWLTMLAALNHDWKIIIIAKENGSHDFKRKLAEFYLQKPLQDSSDKEFEEANKWIRKHYTFVKGRGGIVRTMSDAIDLLYSMSDTGDYQLVFLDPYSGFDQAKKPGETAHEMDIRFNSELLDFTEKTGISVILSIHTVTSARREKDAEGNMIRPNLDSGSGGATFSNRPDQVLVIHRLINHEDPAVRYTTELYLDKDRDLSSGGMLNSSNDPMKLRYINNKFYVNESEDLINKIKNKDKNINEGKNYSLPVDEGKSDTINDINIPFSF